MNWLAKLLLIASLSLLFPAIAVSAEPENEGNTPEKNPLELIEEQSEGNVKFIIPQEVLDKILTTPKVGTTHQSGTKQKRQPSGKLSGYRIQVFSDGHNPASLQARARARGNAIVARLPKYRGQTYTFSRSPNWYTTIGNFQTLAEANAALSELRRNFPSFSSEMRIVKSSIVVLK